MSVQYNLARNVAKFRENAPLSFSTLTFLQNFGIFIPKYTASHTSHCLENHTSHSFKFIPQSALPAGPSGRAV